MKLKTLCLFLPLMWCEVARAELNYHLVGWLNTVVPGAGQMAMGNSAEGFFQLGYESTAFVAGYFLSARSSISLDGFTSTPPSQALRRGQVVHTEKEFTGDILQEFGIKAHMFNTFDAYRLSAAKSEDKSADYIDRRPTSELFLDPFQGKNLKDPYVLLPLSAIFSYVMFDFFYLSRSDSVTVSRLSPSSNALYGFNQAVWQPFGSGAPEEGFYRGFLQNEFRGWTHNSPVSIAMSSALFSISHQREGRISAAVAGAYLGFLADHFGGHLAPGITLHFWADFILGVESLLLLHRNERTTPPTGMSVQVDF